MPLRFDVEAYLGTNADRSPSDEYCYYCLKDGEYTVDIPMNEMVDIWVKYTDKYNWYSSTNYTSQELRILLNKRLPTLKRWRQKEETQHIHYETVNRIKTHIDRNLFTELTAEKLASMANLSFFHFRRVFRNITGENIGTYIQRLRLEYIAHLLIATGQSIENIQKQSNYQTKFSLAKIFKKHFGMSMSEYRSKHKSTTRQVIAVNLPDVEIRRINTLKALCIEVGDTFRDKPAYRTIWRQLTDYRKKHLKEIPDSLFISISQDNPLITPVNKQRFYIGIISMNRLKPEGKLFMQEISGGMYAVFKHKGNYTDLSELYKTVYEQWLPQTSYHQKYPLTFEIYLNTPDETSVDELLTEIYIPIDK